jgi:hypothetical protein
VVVKGWGGDCLGSKEDGRTSCAAAAGMNEAERG